MTVSRISRVRRAVGPGMNFAGRIAGIAVTVIVVRYTGIGPSAVPVLLALAIFTFGQAALAGPIELQVIAEVGRRPELAAAPLLGTSLVLGVALGAVLTAVTVVLSATVGSLHSVATYFLPLGFGLPLAACFGAAQGIDIAHGRWMRSGVASFVRTVVVIVLIASTIGAAGLVVVPLAVLAGELVRLCMLVAGRHWLVPVPRVERLFARRVVQQVPSSMVSSIAPTLDRLVVTTLGLGNIAVLDLAEKATGFFNLSVSQGVIPVLYRRWTRTGPGARRVEILSATRILLGVCLGIAAVAAVLLPPIVAAVAGVSGGDGRAALDATVWILLAGFPGYVASQAVVRLMILEDLQRWFNLTAAIQLALNVVLDVALGIHFGVPGVAAATAIVWWLGLVLCVVIVRRAPTPASIPAMVSGGSA